MVLNKSLELYWRFTLEYNYGTTTTELRYKNLYYATIFTSIVEMVTTRFNFTLVFKKMTNSLKQASLKITAWKVSKYGGFWSVFSPNAGKYGPEKTLYLETFYFTLLLSLSSSLSLACILVIVMTAISYYHHCHYYDCYQ